MKQVCEKHTYGIETGLVIFEADGYWSKCPLCGMQENMEVQTKLISQLEEKIEELEARLSESAEEK
jgi:transcription initiation factor IIE alpha subunit